MPKIVYTQMLNERGGIEADITVTRLSETAYLMVTPAATVVRDMSWLKRHSHNHNVVMVDVTPAEGVIAVMGPNAVKLLSKVSPHDWSNENHPFGTAHEIEIGMGLARAHRVTYVGELGFEIYSSSDQTPHVFETLLDAGKELGVKLCGMHMMDSCRIEKGYRHFGHDITDEDHVLEAGLGFAVKTDKPDFIGRDAVLRKRDSGLQNRMLQFKTGNYGHALGSAIGLGYVPCEEQSVDDLLGSSYEIEIAGQRHACEVSLRPTLRVFFFSGGDCNTPQEFAPKC